MIGYRYFCGNDPTPSEGADSEEILKQLSDHLLRENDIGKSLDLFETAWLCGVFGSSRA